MRVGMSILLIFSILLMAGGLLLGVVFLSFGVEGALVSAGLAGAPGTMAVTRCTTERGHPCFGIFYPAAGGGAPPGVQYQGDAEPGTAHRARLWPLDPTTAWPQGWSSWYRWVPSLLGGLVTVVLSLFWALRAVWCRWRTRPRASPS